MKKHVEKHLTLREKILETIRDAIIAGALKPGEKVAEPELAERFGISRKFAIPLLEYLDRERVTRRVGESRIVL